MPQAIVTGADLVTATFAVAVTFNVALAATVLAPALVVKTPIAMVLAYAPAAAAVTSIWKVHEPVAGTVPPVKVTLPAVLVTTPLVQDVAAFGVAARTKPEPGDVGKVSVTLVTVMAAAFGLVMVICNVDDPPDAIGLVRNVLLMVGAVAVTVKFTLAEPAPVGASLLDTPVAKFGWVPTV